MFHAVLIKLAVQDQAGKGEASLIGERRGELRLILWAWGVVMWGLPVTGWLSPSFPVKCWPLMRSVICSSTCWDIALNRQRPLRADQVVFPWSTC